MSENGTLTVAVRPYKKQVGKLHQRVLAAARKSGISPEQFQAGLGWPGTELEDELLRTIVKFSKRASGILTPVRAQDTGLVPSGWTVESDDLEGDINLSKLSFVCPLRNGETSISGSTLLARTVELKAFGSLGFGKFVLDAQKEGKDIISPDLRGKGYIVLSRTVLRSSRGSRRVAYLDWDGTQWCLDFSWLDYDFHSFARLVRASE